MRAEIIVKGIVQGVGFRPFLYRTAVDNKLVGYVKNRAGLRIVGPGAKEEKRGLFDRNSPVECVYLDSSGFSIEFEGKVDDNRGRESTHHVYSTPEAVDTVSWIDYV